MTNVTRVGAQSIFEFIAPTGFPVLVEVTLGYRADDPHAVSMEFRMGHQHTTWLMSRDLLADGLITASGGGDVRLRPHNNSKAVLELRSDDSQAVFHLSKADLQDFLNATYDLVPPGRESEHLDLDAELRALLQM